MYKYENKWKNFEVIVGLRKGTIHVLVPTSTHSIEGGLGLEASLTFTRPQRAVR
jgi:hypothetical protein